MSNQFSCLCINSLSLKTLEAANCYMLNKSVKLLIGILILVSLSTQPNTDALGWVSNTLRPNILVYVGADTDILGSHGLLSEFLDFLDGLGCLRLEGSLVGALGKVDCVIPCNKIGLRFRSHFYR